MNKPLIQERNECNDNQQTASNGHFHKTWQWEPFVKRHVLGKCSLAHRLGRQRRLARPGTGKPVAPDVLPFRRHLATRLRSGKMPASFDCTTSELEDISMRPFEMNDEEISHFLFNV